jgi:hypothetical protein
MWVAGTIERITGAGDLRSRRAARRWILPLRATGKVRGKASRAPQSSAIVPSIIRTPVARMVGSNER